MTKRKFNNEQSKRAIAWVSILAFFVSFFAPLGGIEKVSASFEAITGLNTPVGFDYYNGEVYVAQATPGGSIVKFDSTGTKTDIVTGVHPLAVTVHSDGHLFYRANSTVYVIKKSELDTRTDTTQPGVELFASQVQLTGMEFHSNGDLYIAAGTYVWKIPKAKIDTFLADANQKLIYSDGPGGTTDKIEVVKTLSSPNHPYDIEFDPNGNLYIVAAEAGRFAKVDRSSLEGVHGLI
ncbi:hypothetical protein [Marinicrinis sediminis]|uniref:SMP-30/Gluconolactonase/LRE-like region domain-containing protein n=1 Tax=Marinicrinis sediminis TaxID=1652465 RepID=A0ABW5R6W9_9BACL